MSWKRLKKGQNRRLKVFSCELKSLISKPLRRGSYIAGSDGGRPWVTSKYERLPMFCHYYGLLGHNIRHYAGHYAALKNEKEVLCQYRDWLKAVGVCYVLPSKKKPNQSTATDEGVGEKKKDNDSPNPPYCTVAAVIAHTTNPTEGGSYEKGKSNNQGTITDLQAVTNLSNEERGQLRITYLLLIQSLFWKCQLHIRSCPLEVKLIKMGLLRDLTHPGPSGRN